MNKHNVKNLVTILVCLLLCTKGFSQMKKGSFSVSGRTDLNFLFSNTTTARDSIAGDKLKNNQFNFTVGFGYFIADNLIIALSGSHSYSYTRIENAYGRGEQNITTTLGIVPQIGYYLPVEGKLKPSLSIGVGYLLLRERDSKVSENHNIVYSLSGPSYNGTVGLSYFFSRTVSFDFGMQYSHSSLKDKMKMYETQKQNAIGGACGLSIFF